MDESRRAQIYELVKHFEGKPVTNNSLIEHCNLNKVTPALTTDDLADARAQVSHDEKMAVFLKDVTEELSKLHYIPEYAPAGERKKMLKDNEEVHYALAKKLEEKGFSYNMVSLIGEEVNKTLTQVVTGASNAIFNKSLQVLLNLARKEFGDEFNTLHVKEYAEKLFNKDKKEEK